VLVSTASPIMPPSSLRAGPQQSHRRAANDERVQILRLSSLAAYECARFSAAYGDPHDVAMIVDAQSSADGIRRDRTEVFHVPRLLGPQEAMKCRVVIQKGTADHLALIVDGYGDMPRRGGFLPPRLPRSLTVPSSSQNRACRPTPWSLRRTAAVIAAYYDGGAMGNQEKARRACWAWARNVPSGELAAHILVRIHLHGIRRI
jgi:hypothetical protein